MNDFRWEIAGAFIAITFVIYVLWRRVSKLQAERKIAQLLPPSDALVWQKEPETGQRYQPVPAYILCEDPEDFIPSSSTPLFSTHRQQFAAWEEILPGALDGAIGAAVTLHSIESIDPAVLHAVTQSTAEHLSGLQSIDHYIDSHFFSAGVSSAHGFFERLTGYVAEHKAATALEGLGHHVQFAATANQPVWDLLVDGHPVQIKEGLAGVKEFVAQHHEIPVYTGFDNADSLHDPMVHGLHGLGSEAIHHTTQQSLDGLHGTFHPSFHFPVVTFCMSTFRELRLLNKEHTTLDRALFHVTLDTLGVGSGAFLGAKAGTLIGSVVPGPGTMVGAVIGTIAGGIAGKIASNEIRYGAFKEARAAYEQRVSSWNFTVETAWRANESKIKAISRTYQRRFEISRHEILQSIRSANRFHLDIYNQSHAMTLRSLTSVYDEIEDGLARDRERVMKGERKNLWRRVFPCFQDHFRDQANVWFARQLEVVRGERSRFSTSLRTGSPEAARVWSQFVSCYRFTASKLAGIFENLENEHNRTKAELKRVRTSAELSITALNDRFRKSSAVEIEDLCVQIAEQVSPANARVKEARDKLIREGKAIGISIPEDLRPTPKPCMPSTDESPHIFCGDLGSLDTV